MKNKYDVKSIILSVIGLVVMIVGIVSVKSISNVDRSISILPYIICVGGGAGIFGHNIGNLIKEYISKRNPDTVKTIEIELKDERNIAISNKAKAKAFELMQSIFGALIVIFALMQVNMYVVLALIAAYLFVVLSAVYYLKKFHREM